MKLKSVRAPKMKAAKPRAMKMPKPKALKVPGAMKQPAAVDSEPLGGDGADAMKPMKGFGV